MLAVKDHYHVFSKEAIGLSEAQFLAATQYLGCIALLFKRFQIVHTSSNIGARCDVMIYSAFFENIWWWTTFSTKFFWIKPSTPKSNKALVEKKGAKLELIPFAKKEPKQTVSRPKLSLKTGNVKESTPVRSQHISAFIKYFQAWH